MQRLFLFALITACGYHPADKTTPIVEPPEPNSASDSGTDPDIDPDTGTETGAPDTDTGKENTPLQTLPIVEVTAGGYHTCVRYSDNSIDCWGRNNVAQSSPPTGSFSKLSAGGYHTCALTITGAVACWGANELGQSVTQSGVFTDIEAGEDYTCGVSNNTVISWDDTESWTTVPGNLSAVSVHSGSRATCAVTTSVSIECWDESYWEGWSYDDNYCSSYNYYEYCGISSQKPAGTFQDIAVTSTTACAINTSGVIECWGGTARGLQNAPGGNWTTSNFTQIEAGWEHLCAPDSTGVVHCWGHNDSGEIEVPYGQHAFIQVSVGNDHSCGVKANGELLCWGSNTYDQLGEFGW